MKAGYGKTVRPVCAADGGKLFIGRLLRPDSNEAERTAMVGNKSSKRISKLRAGDPASSTPCVSPVSSEPAA